MKYRKVLGDMPRVLRLASSTGGEVPMKKRFSNQSKQSFRLADLEHRVSMYALAASAAGVGMLALAQPAEGKIVYTKAHVSIGQFARFPLDLNHDGVPDFALVNSAWGTTFGGASSLAIFPYSKSNQVWGTQGVASALYAGVKVGPKGPFLQGGAGMVACQGSIGGNKPCFWPWNKASQRYLGLKFSIKGKTHFGWARLTMSCPPIVGSLTGYAYETIPNRPIITGKTKGSDVITVQQDAAPGGLGRLALGRK
jgi:hypothetical protein